MTYVLLAVLLLVLVGTITTLLERFRKAEIPKNFQKRPDDDDETS